jgi:hypothetical protein
LRPDEKKAKAVWKWRSFKQNINLITPFLGEEPVDASNDKTYYQKRNTKPEDENKPHRTQDKASPRKVAEGIPNKFPTTMAFARRKPTGAPRNNGWQCETKNYDS